MPESTSLKHFLRLSRPVLLLDTTMVYGLGAAIAHYLGHPFSGNLFWIGLGTILLLRLSTHYMSELFHPWKEIDYPVSPLAPSGVLRAGFFSDRVAQYAIAICLASFGTLLTALLLSGTTPTVSWILLGLLIMGYLSLSMPPLHLAVSGYGEILLSIFHASLVPAFAFTLQSGEIHRLLTMSTTPILALYLAMLIALQLPLYGVQSQIKQKTILTSLGWSTAMTVHDLAILFAIITLTFAYVAGLPRRVFFGSLIIIPLAAMQIWQMRRIRHGNPPNYRLTGYAAMGLYALAVYLEIAGYLLL